MKAHIRKQFIKAIDKGLLTFNDDSYPFLVLVLRENNGISGLSMPGHDDYPPEVVDGIIEFFQAIKDKSSRLKSNEIVIPGSEENSN